MKNKIVKSENTVANPANIALRNILDFARSFENIQGIKVDVAVQDNGKWHTLTQRVFKNGSIHVRKH